MYDTNIQVNIQIWRVTFKSYSPNEIFTRQGELASPVSVYIFINHRKKVVWFSWFIISIFLIMIRNRELMQ